jgi:hypothetical protein
MVHFQHLLEKELEEALMTDLLLKKQEQKILLIGVKLTSLLKKKNLMHCGIKLKHI